MATQPPTLANSNAQPNGEGRPTARNPYDRRVVITGVGAVTPLGLTLKETWSALLEGRSGIDYITRFDTSELRTRFAGEVRNFDPANYMDRKEARRLDPAMQYALAATQEAVADAAIDFADEDPERCGVIVAAGLGGIQALLENQQVARTRGLRKVSPFMISNMLSDSVSGKIAIDYNLQGINHSMTSACATGTGVSGEAFEIIRRGDADVLIAGGSDAAIVPIIIAGFDIMGAFSQHNEDPAGACRPFDRDRDGFVMSEGAAILIMESEEHARARGARVYAEVIGYGSSADAYSMAAPHETGRGAIDAMTMALRKAAAYGVKPTDIDYINAHGTATRLNDMTETWAIKHVLGEHAYNVNISSTKSMLGHLLSAAGAVEAIICAKTIHEGVIAPTINLHNQDPECDLNYTPLVAKRADINVTLSNSFGFGGHNACIMLRKYP